jgi:hypothetical protein
MAFVVDAVTQRAFDADLDPPQYGAAAQRVTDQPPGVRNVFSYR